MEVMIKRLLPFFCLLAVLLSVCGCSKDEPQATTDPVPNAYKTIAQSHLDNGDLNAAIAVLQEGIAITGDPELSQMLSSIPLPTTLPTETTVPTEATTVPTEATTVPPETTEETVPPTTQPAVDGSYLVTLYSTTPVYSSPSENSSFVQYVGEYGIYTIVAQAWDEYGNLWGKLKSGVGWVCLSSVSEEEQPKCMRCQKTGIPMSDYGLCADCNEILASLTEGTWTDINCGHRMTVSNKTAFSAKIIIQQFDGGQETIRWEFTVGETFIGQLWYNDGCKYENNVLTSQSQFGYFFPYDGVLQWVDLTVDHGPTCSFYFS